MKQEKYDKVLRIVAKVRKERPKTGTKKLYGEIKCELEKGEVKMGRDKLNKLLAWHGMQIKKTKRFHITTDSNHGFFKSPNRLKDIEPTHAEQAFVGDITYIQTDRGHTCLAIVTDAYSRKIMGWDYDDNMRATLVVNALKMAYKNSRRHKAGIIRHSDRGIQYCCPEFSNYAQSKGFPPSTTQQYDPYENAVAERINGILKYEFGLKESIANRKTAKKMIEQAVRIYNTKRLHWSLGFQTPEQVHQAYGKHPHKSYRKGNRA